MSDHGQASWGWMIGTGSHAAGSAGESLVEVEAG